MEQKSLTESMACGVPIVTIPVGQSVELVENKNGLLTNNFSPNLLAEKSLELIEDKNLQINIKLAGKQTALENDYENQVSLWKDFFND